VSCEPRKKEGNLEFGSNQDSVGKGCQKSGCGGYSDCRVVMIYSVVNCKAEESGETQLYLVVKCNKSDCQSNTRLSHLTRDNIYI
jgi:hypothetical protein